MNIVSRRTAIAGALSGLPLVAAAQEPRFSATGRYETRRVRGWTILVHKDFERVKPLRSDTLELLDHQLFQVARAIPVPALEKLRRVRIWIEIDEPHHPCMAYHPGAGWLRDHDMNPEKAKCVEIANARNFLSWTKQQPWMVLHELAHAYHDQVLGFDHAEVRAAHVSAKSSGLYESVLHWNGRTERHYAMTDVMEYFAEGTEAYFGTNDFFPFTRPELERHDPEGYRVIRKAWGG